MMDDGIRSSGAGGRRAGVQAGQSLSRWVRRALRADLLGLGREAFG